MVETRETQTVQHPGGEGAPVPEPEEVRTRWQDAIEAEMKHADGGPGRQWTDRAIAATTWPLYDQGDGPRRGSIDLAVSEDGAQVILSICRHRTNGLDSDVEMGLEAILSLPEAEALAMALLVRRPGRLSSDYANGVAAQCIQIPAPVI